MPPFMSSSRPESSEMLPSFWRSPCHTWARLTKTSTLGFLVLVGGSTIAPRADLGKAMKQVNVPKHAVTQDRTPREERLDRERPRTTALRAVRARAYETLRALLSSANRALTERPLTLPLANLDSAACSLPRDTAT
jgi:hypothetical protein